jgi:hypothetical protein
MRMMEELMNLKEKTYSGAISILSIVAADAN